MLAQQLHTFLKAQLMKEMQFNNRLPESANMVVIPDQPPPPQLPADLGPPKLQNVGELFPNPLIISNQNLDRQSLLDKPSYLKFPPPNMGPSNENLPMNRQPNPNLGPVLPNQNFGPAPSNQNFGPVLPNSNIGSPIRPKPRRLPNGRLLITSRLFGITARAGLGNQLFELASLLGIASQVNRIPFINVGNSELMTLLAQSILPRYPELLEQFSLYFDTFGTMPIRFNNPKCCKFDNVSRLLEVRSPSISLDGVWFQSYKYFHHLRDKIRQWITPNEYIRQSSRILVPGLRANNSVVCVHTRRGDFVTDGYHKPSDESFTLEATRFLIRRNLAIGRKSVVVVMGNDPLWSTLLFMGVSNISIITSSLPEQDLSFSQQFCDNVLITAPSSTFGFWLGYLSKTGSTVYYRDIHEVIHEFEATDFFPKEWFKLRFANGKVSLF